MLGTVVWKVCGSTLMRPRLIGLDADRVEPEAADIAAAAGGIEHDLASGWCGRRPASPRHSPVVEAISFTALPSRIVMPRSRIWWMKSSTISRSTKSRMVLRGSISVTGTSSAEKIVAYSTPMTPPPITVSVRGRRSSSSISSLSKMRLLSKGTLCGRCGRVPTEISALAKPTSLMVAVLVGQA